jgi:DNA polymerase-1
VADAGVLDVETTGKEPWSGRLMCVGWRDEAYPEPLPQHVLDELANPGITKVCWSKYDARYLRLSGIEVNGPLHDGMVKAWLLDEAQPLDLESCALRYLNLTMDKRLSEVAGRLTFRCDDGAVVPLEDAPMDQLTAYCRRDLAATRLLDAELTKLLRAQGRTPAWIDEQLAFTSTLAAMEARGIPVDMARSEALRIELSEEVEKLSAELRADAALPDEFNLASGHHLAAYLYKKTFQLPARLSVPPLVLGLAPAKRLPYMQERAPGRFTVERVGRLYAHGFYTLEGRGLRARVYTKSGQASTAAPKLRTFYQDDAWVAKLLELKQKSTIVNVFLETFRQRAHNGRLYGTLNQTGTDTGRLSASGPNLQQIPSRTELGRRVRGLFRPAAGVFIHGDYGQLEPRIMAHFSGDPALLDAFRNDRDLYRVTAESVFGVGHAAVTDEQRGVCKTLLLGLSYGAGARKMSLILSEAGYPTNEATADGYLRELKSLYRGFFAWKKHVVKAAEVDGYVETIAGRRRRMAARAGETSWKASPALHAANSIIQGSAADIVQRVMVRADREFPELGLLVAVHDELLFEAAEAPSALTLFRLRQVAERGHGFALSVPLVFVPKIVNSWAEGKS